MEYEIEYALCISSTIYFKYAFYYNGVYINNIVIKIVLLIVDVILMEPTRLAVPCARAMCNKLV